MAQTAEMGQQLAQLCNEINTHRATVVGQYSTARDLKEMRAQILRLRNMLMEIGTILHGGGPTTSATQQLHHPLSPSPPISLDTLARSIEERIVRRMTDTITQSILRQAGQEPGDSAGKKGS